MTGTKKVGHLHKCPENMRQEAVIGGYVFATSVDGLFVYGSEGYNLTTAPIQKLKIAILPLNKNRIEEIASGDGQIGDVFYIEENVIYYCVSLDKYSFIFVNINEALAFVETIIEYKASGLKDEFLKIRLENEL